MIAERLNMAHMADTRTPDTDRTKRPASSPAENDEEKRQREGSPIMSQVGAGETLGVGSNVDSIIVNDSTIARIVEAVSARVRSDLLKEMGVM